MPGPLNWPVTKHVLSFSVLILKVHVNATTFSVELVEYMLNVLIICSAQVKAQGNHDMSDVQSLKPTEGH